jgi:O-antigen/teichoic acid export membrane protein
MRSILSRRIAAVWAAGARNPGFAMLLAARTLQLANGFLVSIVLVRDYGIAAAGSYAVASVALSLIALLAGLGLANALPRLPFDDPQRATAALLVTLAILPPAAVAAALYAWCTGSSPAEAVTIAAFALGGFFIGQTNVLQTLQILQNRPGAALAPQAAVTLAIAAAACLCPTPAHFALALLAARAVGNAMGALPLRYGRPSFACFRAAAAAGTTYAPIDVVALLSEQLPILVLSGLLARGDLGIVGIARQIVTAADTPGWSFMQSHYPRIVESRLQAVPDVARGNARLALATAVAALAASAVLAVLVYHEPILAGAMAILLAALPARYMNHLCDQMMRAGGWIRDSLELALLKLVLSIALTAALAAPFGLWGAILAAALLSAVSGYLYRRRAGRLAPGVLPPLGDLA